MSFKISQNPFAPKPVAVCIVRGQTSNIGIFSLDSKICDVTPISFGRDCWKLKTGTCIFDENATLRDYGIQHMDSLILCDTNEERYHGKIYFDHARKMFPVLQACEIATKQVEVLRQASPFGAPDFCATPSWFVPSGPSGFGGNIFGGFSGQAWDASAPFGRKPEPHHTVTFGMFPPTVVYTTLPSDPQPKNRPVTRLQARLGNV